MLLYLLLLPLLTDSTRNDSDFSNWTDIDGKQKIVIGNSSEIDLSGQAFYVSGKSVSSAKSANTAIVSASENIGEATFVKSALAYKPSRKDVKKARINTSVSNSTLVMRKPIRKRQWTAGNGTQPVFLKLKEAREKFLKNSPTKN